MRIELHDRVGGTSAAKEIELVITTPKNIVGKNLRFTRDQIGLQIGGGIFSVGETAFFHYDFSGQHFENRRSRVRITHWFSDSNGRALSSPSTFDHEEMEPDPKAEQVSLKQLTFTLYRPGKFNLNFRVEDLVRGVRAEYRLPLLVIEHGR